MTEGHTHTIYDTSITRENLRDIAWHYWAPGGHVWADDGARFAERWSERFADALLARLPAGSAYDPYRGELELACSHGPACPKGLEDRNPAERELGRPLGDLVAESVAAVDAEALFDECVVALGAAEPKEAPARS